MPQTEIKTLVPVPGWVDAMAQKGELTGAGEAYMRVPLIYRATQLRCNSLLRLPYHLYAGDDDAAEVDWMYPEMPLDDLLWLTQAALLLAGASFVVKLSNSYGVGKGLQWLNPNTIDVRYENGAVLFQQRGAGKMWTQDQMIYTREFHPLDDIGFGVSAAQVAMQAARLNLNIATFVDNFFSHGAMPITTVSVAGMMPEKEQQRIQNFFRRAVTNVRNAFRVLAVGNDVKIQTTQNPISELATPELNDAARKDVARAFGLPVTMLDSDETYATASQHATTYLLDTVIPAAQRIASALNRQLLEPMGLYLEFTPEEMTEFQVDEAERAGSAQAFNSLVNDAPTLEQFQLAASVMGYDFSEEEEQLIATIYAQKEQRRADMQAQTQATQATQAQNTDMTGADMGGETIDPNEEAKRIERAQFRRYVRKGKDIDRFVFKSLSPCEQSDIKAEFETSEAQANGETSLVHFSQSALNIKSVDAVARQFCARLRKLIKDFWKESELDPNIDLNSELRALIEYHVSAAYFEGLMEGGLTAEDFDADMSQHADDLVFEQYQFVDGFIDAIGAARTDATQRDAVLARAELWCQSVTAAGNAGRNDANASELCEFVLVGDESAESCSTCQRLLGKRHTRKWIVAHGYEVRPGNDNFECGCYNCPHEWIPAKK